MFDRSIVIEVQRLAEERRADVLSDALQGDESDALTRQPLCQRKGIASHGAPLIAALLTGRYLAAKRTSNSPPDSVPNVVFPA